MLLWCFLCYNEGAMVMVIKKADFEDGIHRIVYVEVSSEDTEM